MARVSLSIGITLVDVHLLWLNWFHFLILVGDPLVILIEYMIVLSQFLGVLRMSLSVISFLVQLDSGILIPLTYELSSFKSRVNSHLLSSGSF